MLISALLFVSLNRNVILVYYTNFIRYDRHKLNVNCPNACVQCLPNKSWATERSKNLKIVLATPNCMHFSFLPSSSNTGQANFWNWNNTGVTKCRFLKFFVVIEISKICNFHCNSFIKCLNIWFLQAVYWPLTAVTNEQLS